MAPRRKKSTAVVEAPPAEEAAEPPIATGLEEGAEPPIAVKPEEKAEPQPPPDDGRHWFVIHTYSGYEDKVKANLEHRIQNMDMAHKVFSVVVPQVDEIEIRDGQRRTVPRKIFPGYVLVEMIMDEESWYVVRNTPGVTGFVGSAHEPTPLEEAEVKSILRQMRSEEPRIKVGFVIGQSVRITDGPFIDFIGSVDAINLEKGKVKVLVSVFGRETPVELDFLQVERL
jgi:transcriptional antiterminator NusG